MASQEYDVGAISDFRSGQPYPLTIDGRRLVLVRNDDTFYAMRDVCPHQGASLSSGKISGTPVPCLPGEEIRFHRTGEILICPWHGWEFDLKAGHALAAPLRGRLQTFPVRIDNDRVIVEVP